MSDDAVAALDIRYLETSLLLAALLEQDADAVAALRAPGRRVASALTVAEAHRAIVRARVAGRLDERSERALRQTLRDFFAECDVVSVSEDVLARVGRPFPVEPIRTLDGIHLATAEELFDPPQTLTVLTRDVRVRENAQAMGFATE